MLLNILFTILGVFSLIFFESFFLTLIGIRLSLIAFFFLFRKINWKPFFPLVALVLIIFDVVYKVPLGTNILIFILPYGLFLLISLFISLESGIVSYFIKIIIFWFYYILLSFLPNLFVSGEFGFLNLEGILSSFLRAVLSVLVLLLLEYLYAGFRKRGNASQIQLK
jgi:hypothetical protein